MVREETGLGELYRSYVACLNRQDWERLGDFVQEDVNYNGGHIGLSGYRAMLERDFRDIPDLHFAIQLLAVDPPFVASRLEFDCTPRGRFFDLDVHGRRVSFAENIFYRFVGGKIAQAWSVIDKATVEVQL